MRNAIERIEITHVFKRFRTKEVLKDISLDLRAGHIYGIVGHNGSGKTVLFKCICGFFYCTSGEILVDGKRIGKDLDILTDAGIIIEEPGFLKYWNGFQNLKFLYTIRNRNCKGHLFSILRKVGLDPNNKMPVGKYSLGMRQRLAIAQAIMEDPSVLLLDEPMNGLDKNGINEMRELFSQMRDEGKMILLASHNREDINILCDEVYEMVNGTLIKE